MKLLNKSVKVLLVPCMLFSTVSNLSANKLTEIEKLISSAQLDAGVSQDIQATQLTHYLEQNGYILAVVNVNEEQNLVVDLGSVSTLKINGLNEKTKHKVVSILQNSLEDIPTEKSLDRALSIINSLPGVNGTFAINKIEDGEFELIFNAVQIDSYGGLAIDNPPSQIGEEFRFNIYQNFNSLFMGGDSLHLQGVFLTGEDIKNQTSFLTNYQFPLGSDGAYMEFGASDLRTKTEVHGRSTTFTTGFGAVVVPGTVSSQDFEGQSYYLTSGYPIIKSHDEALYLIGQMDFSVDKTDTIGESEVLHGDIGLFYSKQFIDGKSLHFGGYAGLGKSDSYVQNENNSYKSATLDIASIFPLDNISKLTELRVEALTKISDEHLPNSKLFSLGDEDFLRGYSSGTVLGNKGAVGTIEIKHAVYLNSFLKKASPYVFVDGGFVNNPSSKSNTTNRPLNHELASIGFGSDFLLKNSISINSFVGFPMLDDTSGKRPNPAAYIRLNWSW